MKKTKIAFNMDPLQIPVEQILATKTFSKNVSYTRKYHQIEASIKEIGIIEPLAVARTDSKSEQFILLDGHIRFNVLKSMGHKTVPCLISTDDENYTYNKQINRLSAIQEHFMIKKALDQGVDEERLARALNFNIQSIKEKANLLNGICPEVIELLKNRQMSPLVFPILRKMKSVRQIECTELMLAANIMTVKYAKALLMTTPEHMLVAQKKANTKGASAEVIQKLESDLGNLHLQYKAIEQNYAQDTLDLVLATGYLTKLISNIEVKGYLTKNHPDLLVNFEALVKSSSIDLR
jgi:predicted transcriptional regulator